MRWTLVLSLFLFASCAQVGTLTGGDRDQSAPQPIAEKSEPINQTVNFTGNEIKLYFDEFVGLSKPNENLIVVPPNIQPKVVAKGKKVVISWEDSLLPNTTYAFYLNGLVKDLTEGNDTLLTHVFSTGPNLDSLQQTVRVTDATTGKPIKRAVVGLYDRFADTVKPTYFGETNEKGFATVRYMKSGKYELKAFLDANRNLLIEPNEQVGFLDNTIEVNQVKDTVGLRMFIPEKVKRISTFAYAPPNGFVVGANASMSNSELKVNGDILGADQIHWFAEDSLSFYLYVIDTNSYELTLAGAFVDTNRVRFRQQATTSKWKVQMLTEAKLKPKTNPVFWTPGKLTALDESKLLLKRNRDTVGTEFETTAETEMSFGVSPVSPQAGKYVLQTLPGAIEVAGQKNTDTLFFEWTLLSAEELGVIRVTCPDYDSSMVLQVMSKGKVVANAAIESGKAITFQQMLPGQYSFRVLVDSNGNGKWDTGNPSLNRQPERLILFDKSYTLRANWDLEVELKKSDEPKETQP